MQTLLILVALVLLVFYGWGTIAFWQAASRERLNLLWVVTFWNLLAALGSLFFLLNTVNGSPGLLGTLGAGFAIATPFLWAIGRVASRLRHHGLSLGQIYSFSR